MRILVISLSVICLAISTTIADKLNTEKKYIAPGEKLDPKLSAKDYPPPPPVPILAKTTTKSTTTTIKTTSRSTTTTTVLPSQVKTLKSTTHKKKHHNKLKHLPKVVKSALPKVTKTKSKPLQRKKKLPPKAYRKKTYQGQNKKRPLVKKPLVKKRPEAERRDSSYGAPAPPKRQVIIKQAGPSKQFAWIGHGRYAPLNIPNPFPHDLPKWIPMGNNIFEAGLLYPGKPGKAAAPAYTKPAPPVYTQPAPPPAPPAKIEQKITIDPILPSYESSESVDSYSAPVKPPAPKPEPVYNPQPTYAPIPVPADIPAQPAYDSGSVPSYGASSLIPESPVTAVPAYTTAPPVYKAPTTVPPPPPPAYHQPSYKPFTVFNTPSYKAPEVEVKYEPIGKPGNYPQFDALPGFDGATYEEAKPSYEAQASYESPKTVPPTINSYNVPIKIEESYSAPEEEDQDVYFIFYEDKQEPKEPPAPPPSTPALQGYISEATQVPPSDGQFKPPEDIRTIYVPYESAVNVPDIYDVSLVSSFGYKDQPAKAIKKPVGPPSSYDNPISSFDAPIYDENSYTAEASAYDANTFSGALWRDATKNINPQLRKERKPLNSAQAKQATHFGYQPTSIQFDPSIASSQRVPFGSRLSSRARESIF